MKIAGLDIGTTGCKMTVFDETGVCLEKEYVTYPVSRKRQEHEIDIFSLREGIMEMLRKMAPKYRDLAAIGITSFGESFVITDEAGEPLFPVMLYTDPRGKDECSELKEKIGEKRIFEITGLAPHEMYSIAKLMWVKKHQPHIYSKAAHVFLIQDYIVYLLTGKCQIDYSLAARTMAFDIHRLKWSREILEAAAVEEALFSEPVPTGSGAGKPLADVCQTTGLWPGTEIVSVSHDQVSAAVGAGAFFSDIGVDGAGTVECLTAVLDSGTNMSKLYEGKYAVTPYILPNKYLCYAFSYTGGALLSWFTQNLAKAEMAYGREHGRSVYEILEQEPEEPTGLLVLPHFAGAGTPYMDSQSKGAIIGLTMETDIRALYQGCIEGIAYEMYLNMQILKKAGITFKYLHGTGGGFASGVWSQIKADILNTPIKTLKVKDAGTVGSAMLTGLAIGLFKNLEEAKACMIQEDKIFYPRKEQHEKYESIFERYKKLYQALYPLLH